MQYYLVKLFVLSFIASFVIYCIIYFPSKSDAGEDVIHQT